jgi:hypothetical protein
MLLIPKFILYSTKVSKARKTQCFFLKNCVTLFISDILFFSQDNKKKKLYLNVPVMLNFNLKTSIQKYPIFCSWY